MSPLLRSSLTSGLVVGSKPVAAYLNQVPGSTGDWVLVERYPTAMFGSGRQHEAWIFCRDVGVYTAGGGSEPTSSATDAGAAMISGESLSACASLDGGNPQLLSLRF